MSAEELFWLVVGISALVVAFTGTMYVLFRRFLQKEKQRGETFRSVHRDR